MHLRLACKPQRQGINLSIPVSWDFPLHHGKLLEPYIKETSYFQFPFLGIFLCTNWFNMMFLIRSPRSFNSRFLGFSFAPTLITTVALRCLPVLSIPVSWDFPLHLFPLLLFSGFFQVIFQFPFLGIFLCTANHYVEAHPSHAIVFQFPFLGIFLCTRGDFCLIYQLAAITP